MKNEIGPANETANDASKNTASDTVNASAFDPNSESKSSRHVWLASLMDLVMEFDRSKLIFWIAFRNTVGIAASLILGFVFFGPGAAAFACMGALIVAFGDGDDAYRDRFRRLASSGVLCVVSVFIAMIASEPHWLRLILVPLWGFAGAYALILGSEAADLGLFSIVMLVVYLGPAVTYMHALESSLFCFLGCAIQAGMSLTQWSRGRYRPEKRQIGRLFQGLSRLADNELYSKKSPPLSWQFSRAQTTLSFLSTKMDGESLRLRSLLNQAERLRLRLVTLMRLKKRLMRAQASAELVSCFDDFYSVSGTLMILISETLSRPSATDLFNTDSFSWAKMSDPAIRLRRFLQETAQENVQEKSEGSPEGKKLAPMLRETYLQMESIAGILRASAELSNQKQFLQPARNKERLLQKKTSKFKTNLGILRANFSLRSGAFRHGIRMACCLAVGEIILTFYPLERGYWLPMTIALVLKPDFGTTFSRGILRMGGSLVGLGIATLLFHWFHPSWMVDVLLLSFFTFFLRWIGAANYGIYSIGISAFIVLLTAIMGADPTGVIAPRAINTLVGGSLGLLAYLVWPAWEKLNGRDRLINLLQGYRDYCGFAFQLDSNELHINQLDHARQVSRLARANFQSFILRLASEPGVAKTSLRFFDAVLASTNRLAHAAMAIEADSKNFHSVDSRRAYMEYVDILIHNLDFAIANLKKSANSSSTEANGKIERVPDVNFVSVQTETPKDLRVSFLRWIQAEQIDGSNLTHLAIEMDRMTNSSNTVIEQVLKFPARELESVF